MGGASPAIGAEGALLREAARTSVGWEESTAFMKKVRDTGACVPEAVFEHASHLLSHHRARLPQEEAWLLHEEAAVAALGVGRPDAAAPLLAALGARFPGSGRVARLRGMAAEAAGDAAAAEAEYSALLAADPHCRPTLRRRAAAARGRGDAAGAADALAAALDVHQADVAGWEAAAGAYLAAGQPAQAAFCAEEVLAHTPGALSAQLLLAEALYAAGGGGADRGGGSSSGGGGGGGGMAAARATYAGVVEATGGRCVRALYGVLAADAAAAGGGKRRPPPQGGAADLAALAAEALEREYAERAPEKLHLARASLRALGALQ